MEERKFEVGDRVFVVAADRCKWGANKYMRTFNGKVVTIKSREWSTIKNCNRYRVEEDGWGWAWSADCFEYHCADLPEFDVPDADSVLMLIS